MLRQQSQLARQQPRRLLAFAEIGIAQVARAFGHAVEAHDQMVGPAVIEPVAAGARGQRLDVAGVVVVAVDEAQLGQAALVLAPRPDRIDDAGRRGPGVLRVGRQHQDPRGTFGLERVELRGDGRIAVTHGGAHRDAMAVLAQPSLQQRGLLFGPDLQRRALGGPDGRVLGGRLGRAQWQDRAAQQRLPHQWRNLDDARVAEEFGQVLPHRGGGGLVRRAQVAVQHTGQGRLAVRQGRFRSEWRGWEHEVFSLNMESGAHRPCLHPEAARGSSRRLRPH